MKRPGIVSLIVFCLVLLVCIGGGYSLFQVEVRASDKAEVKHVEEGMIDTALEPNDLTGQTYEPMATITGASLEAFINQVRLENKGLYLGTKAKGKKSKKGKKKGSAKAAAFTGVLDLNSATAEQLSQIKGLGKKTAENIVKYRVDNGPFKKAEDIMKVKRIGQKLFDKIKDHIKVAE